VQRKKQAICDRVMQDDLTPAEVEEILDGGLIDGKIDIFANLMNHHADHVYRII
jgi:hypothetical protein